MKALKEGEASGVGGFTSEMIKIRGDCVLEWLWKMSRTPWYKHQVPGKWIDAVPSPYILKEKAKKMNV